MSLRFGSNIRYLLLPENKVAIFKTKIKKWLCIMRRMVAHVDIKVTRTTVLIIMHKIRNLQARNKLRKHWNGSQNKKVTYGSLDSSSLKTWTVSVFDEEHKNVASWLKAKLQIDTHRFTPLLNSWTRVPSVTLKTRITVPFSEAVAILAPDWLKLNAAKGLSWAAIIVFACCKF